MLEIIGRHGNSDKKSESFVFPIMRHGLTTLEEFDLLNHTRSYINTGLGLGGAYSIVFDEDNRVTFALDINKLLVPESGAGSKDMSVIESWGRSFSNKAWRFCMGAEYVFAEQFSVRTGYMMEVQSNGNRKGLTAGAGLQFNAVTLHVSYLAPSGNGISRTGAGNTIRFGLMFDLK
jgi:opacity protein-like surface antigen